ncbi:tRNA lysidine(34) synthetase TilS [Roseobacter sp. CCS2]|uniref:tRNA lysidine(34) synthetase TilS n=1 Tax=Roseobacter sp. CCS2 TaxID=391593 RepID=UPI0000F4029D|nr:tRNA lysidine(34) synthetase TilS [Roseobacter sp. CCS2]EBA13320.1 Probable cell cycle protein [Roseobacter sp. CCS2]
MSVDTTSADVCARFQNAIAASPTASEETIGLSVSGGGDSIALMHLAARLRDPKRLRVLTVDHGLRPEAQQEIALVASQAADLNIDHAVMPWTWDGQGNLQAAARARRWAAVSAWAAMHNMREVWLGHTEDDQVETVLMRLARGSGIDGLTAMYPLSERDDLRILRPLLGCARADLRHWLQSNKIPWCEDPSNDDPRFDRVRARQMFAQLEGLGLTRKRLLQTIDHMQAAHLSLQIAAHGFARQHVRQDAGDLLCDPPALDLQKADAPRRVMAAAFAWVGSRTYRPRFEQLLDTVARARKGMTVTLAGCIMTPEPNGIVRLTREAAATAATRRPTPKPDMTGAFWDHRWFLEGPVQDSLTFKALGDGIMECPNWRDSGMPRTSLLASPSVWEGDVVIAAPLAGLSNGWSARIVADFHSTAFAIED